MLPGHTPNVLGRFSCHQIGVFDGPERCHDIYSSFLAAFGHSSCGRFWHVSGNLRKLARTCLSRPTSIAAPGWISWRLLIYSGLAISHRSHRKRLKPIASGSCTSREVTGQPVSNLERGG